MDAKSGRKYRDLSKLPSDTWAEITEYRRNHDDPSDGVSEKAVSFIFRKCINRVDRVNQFSD